MKTSNWQWLQERFQMTDYELSKNMVRMHKLLTLEISVLEDWAAWLQKRLVLDDWELSAMIQAHHALYKPIVRYTTQAVQ